MSKPSETTEEPSAPGEIHDGDMTDEPERPDDEGLDEHDQREERLSEEEALLALLRGVIDEVDDAESSVVKRLVTKRLLRDPSGMRIGTLALFNDRVDFGGGLSIGSRTGGRPGAERGVPPIDEDRLAGHVDAYLPPPGFDDALERLREYRLLVLATRPGSGREAMACNLLAEALALDEELGSGDGACRLVAEPAVIVEPGWEPPFRDSGYLAIFDAPAGMESRDRLMDALSEHRLAEIAARVKATNSHLVVVAGPARGALEVVAARSGHVLTSIGPVDPELIVERRALGHEPEPDEVERLRHRLNTTGASALLRERPDPHTAARLAEVVRDGGDLAAEVRHLRDPARQVHAWFSRQREPAPMCFTLAAAVLEDASYLTVSDAAVRMHGMLVLDREDGVPDIRFRDWLGTDQPWIEVEVTASHGEAGKAVAPQVRFRSPLAQQAVLGYAWTYLDGHREVILAWLRRLVTHQDVEVRARAAVAAGVMAWSDHEHATQRYLRPWAGGASRQLRQGAAMALGVVGEHPDLTDAVWKQIEGWAAESSSPFGRRLALTAARVAGGILGEHRPAQALGVLRTVMDRDDWSTLPPVAASLGHLMEQGRISEVLAALLDWSRPQDTSPLVAKALSAFAYLAWRPASAADRETPEGLPILLSHAREHRAGLVELWARALARKPAQTQALDALRNCLDTYGTDRSALREITAIVCGVAARRGRHRERMEWYLGQWAGDRAHPSGAAARVLAELKKPRGPADHR